MKIIHNGIVSDDVYTWAGYPLQDLLAVGLCKVRNKYGLPYTLRKVMLKMVDDYLETGDSGGVNNWTWKTNL